MRGPAVFDLDVFCEDDALGFGVLRLFQKTIIFIRNQLFQHGILLLVLADFGAVVEQVKDGLLEIHLNHMRGLFEMDDLEVHSGIPIVLFANLR